MRTFAQLSRAILRATGQIVSGEPVLVSAEILASRRAQCDACLHLQNGRCLLCKCFLGAKLHLATEQCPDVPPRWSCISNSTPLQRP